MAKHKYIESPEQFLQLWEEYKAKIDANPAKEQVATGKGIFTIEKKRPYQRNGFESISRDQRKETMNPLKFFIIKYNKR